MFYNPEPQEDDPPGEPSVAENASSVDASTARPRLTVVPPPQLATTGDDDSLDHATMAVPESLDDQVLVDRYRALDAERRSLEAESAALLAEIERRDVTNRCFGQRTRTWVALTTDGPRRHAARELRVAKLLDACPTLAAALADGRMSTHHLDAIAKATNPRNVDFVVSIQDELIDLADAYVRFEPFERQVRDLLATADEDGGHDPRPERNKLRISEGLNGEVHVEGTFVGQWAATVEETLELMTNQQFRKAKSDNEATNGELAVPSRNTLMALAFVEACRHGLTGGSTGRGPVVDVTLVVHSDEPHRTTTRFGEPVDDCTADLFRCDPVVHPVVVNSLGVPTDLGRSIRFATPEQRRALAVRDGGCIFPGCDSPPEWCDAHHVERWEDDGPTDLDNLGNLCRHHHGVVHRSGWKMVHIGDQKFIITTPTGQSLLTQRQGKLITL